MKEENYIEEGSENKIFHLQKTDNELFNEKDAIAYPVLRVKRVTKKKDNSEDWQLFSNNELVLLLKGSRFSTTEKSFFRTVEGIKFIIEQYKSGKKSVVKIKEALKHAI